METFGHTLPPQKKIKKIKANKNQTSNSHQSDISEEIYITEMESHFDENPAILALAPNEKKLVKDLLTVRLSLKETHILTNINKKELDILKFNNDFINNLQIKLNDKFYYPSIIDSVADVSNLIKVISIPHKECNIDVAKVLHFDETIYNQRIQDYNTSKANINKQYLCTKSVNSTKELNEQIELHKKREIQLLKEHQEKVNMLKSIGINKIKYNGFDEKNNGYEQITPDNFWSRIANLDYADRTARYNIYGWRVDVNQVYLILQSDIYRNKYVQLSVAISNYVDTNTQLSTGLIHHIIFKGEVYFDYVLDSPDYALFILEEEQVHNIPKHLERL